MTVKNNSEVLQEDLTATGNSCAHFPGRIDMGEKIHLKLKMGLHPAGGAHALLHHLAAAPLVLLHLKKE